MTELQKNPKIADTIAKHPFAANQFYMSSGFKQWSVGNPDQAKKVVNAAMNWNKMSQRDKNKFFSQHPTLAQGGAQGGAMGGQQGGTMGTQMSTGTMQGGTMGTQQSYGAGMNQ